MFSAASEGGIVVVVKIYVLAINRSCSIALTLLHVLICFAVATFPPLSNLRIFFYHLTCIVYLSLIVISVICFPANRLLSSLISEFCLKSSRK